MPLKQGVSSLIQYREDCLHLAYVSVDQRHGSEPDGTFGDLEDCAVVPQCADHRVWAWITQDFVTFCLMCPTDQSRRGCSVSRRMTPSDPSRSLPVHHTLEWGTDEYITIAKNAVPEIPIHAAVSHGFVESSYVLDALCADQGSSHREWDLTIRHDEVDKRRLI